MPTSDTRRHIDAARQVLVGVVPNPATQIDQITTALIYKFMDDMDQAAINAGDEPSFFVGALERYAWTRLMDTRMGNQERMNLYMDALMKFSESDKLPPLFRDIFKSAFLPYRSPEVLGLFLKEIDYFDYSHSEELGNAYEYLLSIMSSQGDAGQFRTPRHIIDFIVRVVNPGKSDRVLDPACGTAGFLISAYKHILAQHDGKNADGAPNDEKPLTPDERRTLLGNFEGYDVSPEMVRLSRVNMYLHHFKNPQIFEYNTLSDDERWNDKFDVILANPPFMSPKGGVETHNKFSIASSRSEVLFVDYIMQHLKPKGRAGIIVPEGIIFQSGKGHVQLRKNLLADGLWAVVSLPSGVFNPYAGVKTSVLLFDNELAKRSTEILFVKITNDGFDLGATKRPIVKNDLPKAMEVLNTWKEGKKTESPIAIFVEKAKIAETEDYNLSGDRYRTTMDYSNAKWPIVELGTVCDVIAGQSPEGKNYNQSENGLPFYQGKTEFTEMYIGAPTTWTTQITKVAEDGDILMSVRAPVGPVNIATQKICIGRGLAAIRASRIDRMFLFYFLRSIESSIKGNGGAVFDSINKSQIEKIQIPLPPLEVQQQIVEELDGYQKIISGARQVVENWKPRIEVDPEWEKVRLGEVCEINPKKSTLKNVSPCLEVSFLPMAELSQEEAYFKTAQTKSISEVLASYTYFEENDVLLAKVTPCFENGKAGIARQLKNGIGFGSSEFIVLRPSDKILGEIVYAYIISNDFRNAGKMRMTGTGGLQRIPIDFVRDFQISLPPLEIQKQIVEKIEAERALVEGNKKLIEVYEGKMGEVIGKLWNS